MLSLSERLKERLHEAGAFAVGFSPLEEVAPDVIEEYVSWLAGGNHGGMGYLADHVDIRRNPALLLDGGNDPRPGGTIVSMAFPYYSGNPYKEGKLRIARYALGDDYHEVLRKRLRPVASWLSETTRLEARICVDTAPILERYWACRAGLGFIGRNRQFYIPGHGACFFLAEIVTRAVLCGRRDAGPANVDKRDGDAGCDVSGRQRLCENCGACVKACPGRALEGGGFDSRLCHSYLTIEHRGELPESFKPRSGCVYGCDRCLEVCPLLRDAAAPSPLPEFLPREPLLELTPAIVRSLTPESYSLLLRHSPVKRAKLDGLLRNLRHVGDSGRSAAE